MKNMIKNQISKKIIISITLLLLFCIAISSANAAEHNITSSDNLGGTVQNASSGDTINLDTGTYTNNVTEISIDKNLTIRGNGSANSVIIDAQQLGRIFSVTAGNTLTLVNITLTNGDTIGTGGAIYSEGTLTIQDCIFTNNFAFSGGGAIYNTGNNLNIVNSNFINNSVFGNYGGGLFNRGNDSIIDNCSFINNDANIGDGGAIYSFANNVTINNSEFINNTGIFGGGVRNVAFNMSIINSTFFNNTGRHGGGISNGGNMIVSGNTMRDNIATVLGNEIYNQDQSMGILNLTYLNNATLTVNNDTTITLYATLTDDMGNPVTGQNISFFVNGTFVGTAEAIEGFANITYFVSQGAGVVPVTGDYAGHDGLDIVLKNGQLLIVANTTVTSEITLDKDEYRVNETVHGTITITNTGNNTATNVTTKVNFPPSFVLNPSSVVVSQGTFDPTTGIWSIGDLAPGEIATMTFTGKFTTPGEHTISIETTGDNFATSTDTATAFVEEPTPPTPPEPTPTPENETNETTNVSAVTAAMKETGIPVLAILFVLLSSLGLIIRQK